MKIFNKALIAFILIFSAMTLTISSAVMGAADTTNSNARMLGKLYKFDEENTDIFYDVAMTDDGHVAVGYSDSFKGRLIGRNKGYADALIVKYDRSGNIKWLNTFGGKAHDAFHSVIATDGGYIAAGATGSTDGDLDGTASDIGGALVVKFDKNGNVLWKHTTVGVFNAVAAADGGYIASGSYGNDASLVKYDANGQEIWRQMFGGSLKDVYHAAVPTDDGYVAVGEASSKDGDLAGLGTDDQNAIIVKYDKSGQMIWKKALNVGMLSSFQSVVEADDGYVTAGYGKGASGNPVLVKYDKSGNLLWKKTFDGRGTDQFNALAKTKDGYIAAGYKHEDLRDVSDVTQISQSSLLIQFDFDGNALWQKATGLSQYNSFEGMDANERGFVAVGRSGSAALVLDVSNVTYAADPLALDYGTYFQMISINQDHPEEELAWSTSNPTPIYMGYSGGLMAVKPGEAVLEGVSPLNSEDRIRIPAKVNDFVHITVEPDTLNLTTGETKQLTAEIEPADATNRNVTWTSSNPSVATVDQNGNVTAISKGITYVTAKAELGGQTSTVLVGVSRPYYTISFESNGGTAIESVQGEAGSRIEKPENPKKDGYVFGGWYKDAQLSERWVDYRDLIEADTKLYARWVEDRITVTFNSNGGTPVKPVVTKYYTKLDEPDVKRPGYTLLGWYESPENWRKWIFINDPFYGDTTLAAKWKIDTYTMAFDSKGGSVVKSKTTNYNKLIASPAAPKRTGYTFAGWYKDAKYKAAWDFSKDKVTGNATLYAKWNMVPPAVPKTLSLSKVSTKSAKVTWSKVAGVSGYEVYRADKRGGAYRLVKSTTALQFTNSGLKKGTTYYYKVRAYKLDGAKKVYSKWTAVKSVKR